jgi:hypothetical protein
MTNESILETKYPHCIYGLLDPNIGQFFYVGITSNADVRQRAHIGVSQLKWGVSASLTPVQNYLMGLGKRKQKPVLIVIEELRTNDKAIANRFYRYAERFWMFHLRESGHPIVNKTGVDYMQVFPNIYRAEFEYRMDKLFGDAPKPRHKLTEIIQQIARRRMALLTKITEFRELTTHRSPAVAKAARSQLAKLLKQVDRHSALPTDNVFPLETGEAA